jgi:glycosyltransferase involved in cell wall biosynthesis
MLNKINMTEVNKPKITIVTVVFNRVTQIEQTILSVVEQKYSNVEYIVVDGGSTDGTVEIIKQYQSKLAWWVSEPDKGIYDAMNKGIEKASGEWINFMNCGDKFYSNDSLSLFKNDVIGDILYGDAMIVYPGFATLWKKTPIAKFWQTPSFCHQACFSRVSLMKANGFDTTFRLSSDFDFLFRMWKAKKKFTYIERIICWYDLREGASLQNRLLSLAERKRAVLRTDHSIEKWIYFTKIIAYERMTSLVKKIIGKKITGWITRSLRK